MATQVDFGIAQYFGFDPRTIPNCALWLDSADSNTLTLSGTNVTAWRDKVASLSFTTTINPSISSTAYNGLYPVQFTYVPALGVGSFLVNSSFSYSTSNRSSFMVVGETTSANNAGFLSFVGSGGSATDYFDLNGLGYESAFKPSSQNFQVVQGYNNGGYFIPISGSTATPFGLYNDTYASGSAVLYKNGSQAGTATTAAAFTNSTALYLGTRVLNGTVQNYLTGVIAEVVLFSRALSTVERQQVEGYLAWKWGLTSNLPTSHPFKAIPPTMRIFQPNDISNCVLWLDSADANTLFSDSAGTTLATVGGTIGFWRDKSGSNRNYTQATAGDRPSYASAGSISFTGTGVLINASSWTTGVPYNIFVVGRPLTSTANWRTLLRGFTTDHPILVEATTTRLGYYNNAAGSFYQFGSLTLDGNSTAILYVSITAARAYSAALNGTATLSTASGNGTADSQMFYYLGNIGTQAWGTLNEIIIFNAALSAADRQKIEGYLNAKWRLPASLPIAHPYYNLKALPSTPVFVPTQISTCQAWYDGADSSSFTLSGTSVSQWNDKSGNGYNATQTTAGNRPTYSNNGVNFSRTSSNFLTISVPYNRTLSFFTVATTSSSTQSYYIGRASSFGGGPTIIANYVGSSIEYFNGADRATLSSTPTSTFLAGWTQQSGGRVLGYYNGSNVFDIAQSDNNNAGVAFSTIGNSHLTTYTNYITGTIYEILFYSSALSTFEVRQLEGYLAWKWGLQNNLPTTHPYYKFRP
jgi:hypothetical protein